MVALDASLAAVESSGPSPSQATTARALCHGILGARALSSAPTTLRTVRQFTYGPGIHPAPNAFPGLSGNEVIGVCWTGKPSAGYELYAVAAGYKPVRIEGVSGVGFTSTPRSGFAEIP